MKMKCLVAVVMGLWVVLGAASAGAAVEGDRAPRVMKEVLPVYPAKLAKSGIEGWVVVQFVVNKEGRVVNPSVRSSSRMEFEKPALDANVQWQFEPGYLNGVPVAIRMAVPVTFTYQKRVGTRTDPGCSEGPRSRQVPV